MTHRPELPLCHRVFGGFALIFLAASTALGQAAARPDRGTMPNRTYAVSDVENISLQNGNVGLSIPLASLPPIAGGKLSWTISAHYNSKLWNVTRNQLDEPNDLEWHPYVVDTPQKSDLGGWRIGGAYYFQFRNSNDDFARLWYPGNSGLPSNELEVLNNNQWWKVVLLMPDGSEHEFRRTDPSNCLYNGSQDFLRGYCSTKPTGSPLRYYSVDGSYLFATISGTSDWTLYMPDGARIIQTTDGIQRIQDTNGNKIKIFSDTNGTHYQDEQTGREIVVSQYSATQTRVTYPTVGGTEHHIDINWTTTTVQGKSYMVSDWSPTGGETGGGIVCERLEILASTQMEVVSEIVFPQTEPGLGQRKFEFSYNSDTTETATTGGSQSGCNGTVNYTNRTASVGWGELSWMETPSGSVVEYTYELDGEHSLTPFGVTDYISYQSITEKKITHDGTFDIWAYSINDTFGSVTNPDGSGVSEVKYCASPGAIGCMNERAGLVYRSTRPFMKTERHWTNLQFSGASIDSPGGIVSFNPVVDFEYLTLLDANNQALKMSAKAYQYDYNGNVTQTTDYDWFDPLAQGCAVSRDAQGVPTGVPACAAVLRVVNNSYYNQATSSGSENVYAKRSLSTGTPLILNAPYQSSVGPGSVEFAYDGEGFGVAPTVGNLTSKRVWNDVDSKWITTSSTYGLYGNLATTTDARGKVTTLGYDNPALGLPNHVTVDPENGTGTQTTNTTYDSSTGLVTEQTDINGNLSRIDYTNQLTGQVDPFGRPGVMIGPLVNVNGTNQHHRTTTTYEDHLMRVTVASDLNAENDKLLKSRTTADMLGRPILTEQTEDGANYTIYSRKAYDQMGKITFASSPMRYNVSASTDGWTRVTNDNAGRAIEVATFGGATQPASSGTGGIWTGSVTTAYDANFTTVTDQAGKLRRSMVDGLGRLVRVDEPDGSNNLGSTTSPTQPTSYGYDVLGSLTNVTQGSQTRTFNYDSLSRLRSAINPESGTVTYSYDDNGNLATKTDARNVVSNYVYDALNRVTSRSYSDVTPTVTYAYDTLGIANSKGKLTSVSSSVSTYSYSGYDATGKVLSGAQTVGSQTYPLSYTYDLSGHVKTITYPSNRTVSYSYDNAGRTSAFSGHLGDGTNRNYSTGITYDAGSRMTQEQFGTTTAIYNKLFYNSRGQLSEIREGLTPNDGSWQRGAIINHYSGGCWGMCGGLAMPDNNGNLKQQDHWIQDGNGDVTAIFTQQYDYDSLNRLQRVHHDAYWQQQYSYDRFGNRTIDQANTFGSGINNLAFEVDNGTGGTNRLYAPGDLALADASRQMQYDPAGNLKRDIYTGAGDRTYDAENRMTASAGISPATYSYDGDGRRVKRTVGTTQTWQVYGIGGELIAEYAQNGSPSTPQKEYGYRNGQLLITAEVTAGSGGSAFSFADDPLVVATTIVKAVHLTELRTAVNQARAHANLSAASWAESISSGVTIKASHVAELRTRLDEARQALGLSAASYTDPSLTYGYEIKAAHMQELRIKTNEALTAGGSGGVDIRWLVTDQLGTPRMIFDQSGSLATVSRHDYLPFGEELFAYIGGRTPQQGYTNNDGARQKFTLKERDNETGLDYFLARYYSSTQGRFTSPDEFKGGPHELWVLGSGDPEKQALVYADVTNPQSLNKYQYCFNNPLRYVDPDGQNPQDGYDIRFQKNIEDLNAGRIDEKEYWARMRGGAVGVGAALAIIVAARGGRPILTALSMWAARNPDKVQQIGQGLQEASGGPPGLTLAPNSRLTAAEITTGGRLAKQLGVGLQESAHRGEEFIVAGTKTTIDAMGQPAAYAGKNWGNGSTFFASILRHVNKSADYTALDLKGASQSQVKAIEKYVGGLTKEQQAKIIYVR